MHLTPKQAAEKIRAVLLIREGDVCDASFASERANNIATALSDVTIGEPDGGVLAACEAALELLTGHRGTGVDMGYGEHRDNPIPTMLRDAIADAKRGA